MEQNDSVLTNRTMSKYTSELIESLAMAKAAQDRLFKAVVEYYSNGKSKLEDEGIEMFKTLGAEEAATNFVTTIEEMIGSSISIHLDDLSGTEY